MKIFQKMAIMNSIKRGSGLALALNMYKVSAEYVDAYFNEKDGFCQGELDKQSPKKTFKKKEHTKPSKLSAVVESK